MAHDTVSLSTRVQTEYKQAIARAAAARGVTMAELLRQALAATLANPPNHGPRFGDSQHKPVLEVKK